MSRYMKNITEIPLTSCPLCANVDLTIVTGVPVLFGLLGKKTDYIKCPECTCTFKIKENKSHLRFDFIPEPYSFFAKSFKGLLEIDKVVWQGQLIRTNDPEALNLLSGWRRYMWRLRLLTGSTGSLKKIIINFDWETEKEAKRVLAQIRQMQKEIRLIKREMNQDMKKIRARYGRRKDVQEAKKRALAPYERIGIDIDRILVGLDGTKLEISFKLDKDNE